jgi:hypothetical protein
MSVITAVPTRRPSIAWEILITSGRNLVTRDAKKRSPMNASRGHTRKRNTALGESNFGAGRGTSNPAMANKGESITKSTVFGIICNGRSGIKLSRYMHVSKWRIGDVLDIIFVVFVPSEKKGSRPLRQVLQ